MVGRLCAIWLRGPGEEDSKGHVSASPLHPHLGASGSLEGVALDLDVCITCEVPRIPVLKIFEERSARFVENNISCEVCPNKCSLWCVVVVPLVPHSEREHQ